MSVIINVSGGVAEVVQGNATIIDWDELMDQDCEAESILWALKAIRSMEQGPVKDNMMSSLIDAADRHPKTYWVYTTDECEEVSQRYPRHFLAIEQAWRYRESNLFALNAEGSNLYIEPVI